MSIADLLEWALTGLKWDDRSLEQARTADPVRRFGTILRYGCDTWVLVAKALNDAPDFQHAAELLRTRLTFEARAGNPYTFEFEKDIRLALDSRAVTGGTADDDFILAVAPVRKALYDAESVAAAAIGDVNWADSEVATLPGRAAALRARADRAWTGWGRRRLRRRAARLDTRAATLASERKRRIHNARAQVRSMSADARKTRRVFEAWLAGARAATPNRPD